MSEKQEKTHVPPTDTSGTSAFNALWRQEANRLFDEAARASERNFQEASRTMDEMMRMSAAQLQWSRELSRAFFNGVRGAL